MAAEQKDHTYCTFGDTYLKYRKVVAEWMVDVCEYFKLHATTAHAAIAYLDRLQPNEKFSRFEWQMLAISCILIASKYNECEDHVPSLATLEDITQQDISNETLLNYELWALKRMGWKLNARTPIAFLSCHMVHEEGIIKADDVLAPHAKGMDTAEVRREARNNMSLMLGAMATTCLLNIEYKHYIASDVATAIVYVARERLENLVSPVWTAALERDIGTLDSASVQEIIAKLKTDILPLPPTAPTSSIAATLHAQHLAKKAHHQSPTSVEDMSSPFAKKINMSSQEHNSAANKENTFEQYVHAHAHQNQQTA